MRRYKLLSKEIFASDNYSIVPIRDIDKYEILDWRNEQMYHLRQSAKLSKEDQNLYFSTTIASLFEQDFPEQLLFSFLRNGEIVGYGGLVHINWVDKNAEISFLIKTKFEHNCFAIFWDSFLELIERVAFIELQLHKIYTYAFDIRPKLYEVLENSGYTRDAILTQHCFYQESFRDVVIHSKFSNIPRLRNATKEDEEITYLWVSDPAIRKYAFNREQVLYEDHSKWFWEKLSSPNCEFYIFELGERPIGSMRIDIVGNVGNINYLLDSTMHGKGYGSELIRMGEKKIMNRIDSVKELRAIVLVENVASKRIFERQGYTVLNVSTSQIEFKKDLGRV